MDRQKITNVKAWIHEIVCHMKYMKFGIDRSLSTAETGEAGSKKASYNSKDMDLKVMGS